MLAKSKWMWVVVLVTILSLVGVASAMAQAMPDVGSPAAAWNDTGLVTLPPGQQHWYTFLSAFADPKAGDRQFTVMLSNPQGGVTFKVWTPAGLQRAAAGHTDINAMPVGVGTLHPVKDGDRTRDRYDGKLEWTGGSGLPQAYVIQVQSNDSSPEQYDLTVNGNFVQFPDGALASQASKQGAPSAGAAQTAQPSAQAAPATTNAAANEQPAAVTTGADTNATADQQIAALKQQIVALNQQIAALKQQLAAATTSAGTNAAANQPAAPTSPAATPPASQPAGPVAGSSPDTALPLDGAPHQINPGQDQWYVLNYPGKLVNGDIPAGTVEIIAKPSGSANFNIWTRDRLRARELGNTGAGVPVASGSQFATTREGVTTYWWDGNPIWTNKSDRAETFLIQVQTTGKDPSTYTLAYHQQ